MNEPTMQYPLVVFHHPPWNKNRVIGQKAPFRLREICTIRAYLDYDHNLRDRALLDVALDSKLRGGDVIKLHVDDVCHGEHVASPRWPLQIPPPVATQIPPGRTGEVLTGFVFFLNEIVGQAKRVRPEASVGERWARREPRRGCPQA